MEGFEYIGEGLKALDSCWPWDIIALYTTSLFGLTKTNHHIGIITGPGKTCSGGTDEIIEND